MEAIAEALRDAFELLRIKRRHRPRLATDFKSLITGLRPLVMVDYLPSSSHSHLLQALSAIVKQVQQRVHLAELRIMFVEDCVYVFQQANLHKYMQATLSSRSWLQFVALDGASPRMASAYETADVLTKLHQIHAGLMQLWCCKSQDEPINISSCIRQAGLAIPTVNGWFLAYPVIYKFNPNQVTEARSCLSSEDLHLYQLLTYSAKSEEAEVLSFTVPSELSKLRNFEPWSRQFMSFMEIRAEGVASLRLKVTKRALQSVAF